MGGLPEEDVNKISHGISGIYHMEYQEYITWNIRNISYGISGLYITWNIRNTYHMEYLSLPYLIARQCIVLD
jgi:hypothetical protein